MTVSSKTHVYDNFLDYSGLPDRPGQREAVRLLVELSDGPSVEAYAIQAPTGTGKSFAALLAGVHNAQKGRRTVIGTSTVVLSDQYAKDISFVASHFPDVTFCVLKGASNYYCGNKAAEEISRVRDPKKKRDKMNELVLFRKGITDTLPIWAQSDTEYCADCSDKMRKRGDGKTECEYVRARAKALEADVVVTTHAMINIDTKMKTGSGVSSSPLGTSTSTSATSAILGKVWLTVFDEAHKASESLVYSESFGTTQLSNLMYHGCFNSMPPTKRNAFADHFLKINESDWYAPTAALAEGILEVWPSIAELKLALKVVGSLDESSRIKAQRHVWFLYKAREVLLEIARGDNGGGVALWAVAARHSDGLSTRRYKIKEMIPEPMLVKGMNSMRTAWMSATIGTETHPTYSLKKCGMAGGTFKSLPSPFDYSAQLKWTVRTDADVKDQGALVAAINRHWEGGCAVLTPYHRRKEKIANSVRMHAPDVLVQEQSSSNSASANAAAVASHITSAEAGGRPVLVGVEIFSTGIDLPGPQLTKLIIADLFPLRDDYPFVAWRGRWIESVGGGNAFDDYVLPERAIVLEQQIGRIVRRETDEGVAVFYVANKDWRSGSQGERIIREALRRFPGAVQI